MDKLTTATHDYKINLWTERIRKCRKSGMPVLRWCEENEISAKTYYYWMRKIKREAFDTISSSRVPAIKTDNALAFSKIELEENEDVAAGRITVQINGININIYNGASETAIQNTLRAVRGIC